MTLWRSYIGLAVMSRFWPRIWAMFLAMLWIVFLADLITPVHAQVAFSASVESDYRFRGVSLSYGRPDVRLGMSYDHKSGAYAGLSLIGAGDNDDGIKLLGYVDYAGYIVRPKQGPAWEVGVTNMHVHDRFSYDFSEAYAGVVGDHFSARLYYAPRYFGRPWDTVYADFSGGKRLSPHWRAFAHAGILTPLSGPFRGERYDLRGGVAVSIRNYELQMAWTRTNPVPANPGRYTDEGDGLLVTASAYF